MVKVIHEKGIEFIEVGIPDIHGILRKVLCDADYFVSTVLEKGLQFKSPSIAGCQITGEKVEECGLAYRNGVLIPDLDTFRILPWVDSTAHVLCDFQLESFGINFEELSCRQICKKQLAKLEDVGWWHLNESYG